MLARVHNRRPQGAELFGKPSAMKRSFDCRGEKKCAKRRFLDLKIVDRGRAPPERTPREDGSRTGSAIFVAKSDGSSPSLTEPRAHKTNNSCVQRSRTSQTPLKLPTRTTLTYKIPNASPKGCISTSNTKTSLTKKQPQPKRKR